MLKEIHDHITSELNQGAKTDTIFVITAIVFNLIVLGVNSGIAGSASDPYNTDTLSQDIILVVFTILCCWSTPSRSPPSTWAKKPARS